MNLQHGIVKLGDSYEHILAEAYISRPKQRIERKGQLLVAQLSITIAGQKCPGDYELVLLNDVEIKLYRAMLPFNRKKRHFVALSTWDAAHPVALICDEVKTKIYTGNWLHLQRPRDQVQTMPRDTRFDLLK